MTTPTDDELLAQAKTVVAGRSDSETAKYRDAQLNGWFVFAVKLARGYIALHERHRAEVERLTRENNNLSAGQKHALESCWAAESALSDMTRERDHWRAQCERCADDNVQISRLRNEAESALAAATLELDKRKRDCFEHIDEIGRLGIALAAERKRVGELEKQIHALTHEESGEEIPYCENCHR